MHIWRVCCTSRIRHVAENTHRFFGVRVALSLIEFPGASCDRLRTACSTSRSCRRYLRKLHRLLQDATPLIYSCHEESYPLGFLLEWPFPPLPELGHNRDAACPGYFFFPMKILPMKNTNPCRSIRILVLGFLFAGLISEAGAQSRQAIPRHRRGRPRQARLQARRLRHRVHAAVRAWKHSRRGPALV